MTTELRTIATDGAPKAIGPYSQAMAAGELIFCAGQVALDPASGESVTGDVRAQTERVLENLSAVLSAAGSDLRHVVKTTVYLTDFNDFAAMNEVYAARFGDHRPARATVGVSALPKGLRLEIECVAIRAK
ncbi:MAG TPA: RidA family protein [Candidatus Saccharimonadales bacterium]|jgi:2-iminobutanoate/2-iminopropanoate deaminase|nr:RidA family protein [Candidatus Saccharimonadales bacterium]